MFRIALQFSNHRTWLLAIATGFCIGGGVLHWSDSARAQAQSSPEEQKRKQNEQKKKQPSQQHQGRPEHPRGASPGTPGRSATPPPQGRSGGSASGHLPGRPAGQPETNQPRQALPRGNPQSPPQQKGSPPPAPKRQAAPANPSQPPQPSGNAPSPSKRVTTPAPGDVRPPPSRPQKSLPPPQPKRQAAPVNPSQPPQRSGNAPSPGSVKPAPSQPQRGVVRQATPPSGPTPGAPKALSRPTRLEDVKRNRRVTTGPSGARIIEEPGNRVIIRQNNRVVIRQNEITQVQRFTPNAQVQKLPNGVNRTVVIRPGGVRVFNEVDRNGRLLRRYRRDPSGREIVLIDNRRFYRNVAIGVGVAALGVGIALALAPPRIVIPRNRYIVDYTDASDDDIYVALSAPPVERLERAYSLEEIRYSESLRARMRRIDLDTVNFEFGSFEVPPDQYSKLERLARVMHRIIERDPAEVFLVEGHTDAVGSDDDNLTLSDNRCEAVADILIREFDIPPENIVTQGYGEQFLKVDTQEPERVNRRVAVRRVTPLLGLADQH